MWAKELLAEYRQCPLEGRTDLIGLLLPGLGRRCLVHYGIYSDYDFRTYGQPCSLCAQTDLSFYRVGCASEDGRCTTGPSSIPSSPRRGLVPPSNAETVRVASRSASLMAGR